MVVDSSVLIAILLAEEDANEFLNQLIIADQLFISAVSLVETAMVIEYKKGSPGATKLDELLQVLAPKVIEFDHQQAELARTAWRNYGKGKHSAKLNFGDCWALLHKSVIH